MLKRIYEFFGDVCVTYCICVLVVAAVSFAVEEISFTLLLLVVALVKCVQRLARRLKNRRIKDVH